MEFLEYLLPQKMSMGALHCNTTGVDRVSNTDSSEWHVTGMGTIEEAVVSRGCLVTEDSCLKLYILQVFRYKSRLLSLVANLYA
jgi:hypothetical protein